MNKQTCIINTERKKIYERVCLRAGSTLKYIYCCLKKFLVFVTPISHLYHFYRCSTDISTKCIMMRAVKGWISFKDIYYTMTKEYFYIFSIFGIKLPTENFKKLKLIFFKNWNLFAKKLRRFRTLLLNAGEVKTFHCGKVNSTKLLSYLPYSRFLSHVCSYS